MNLSNNYYTQEEFLTAMPADLRERYIVANTRALTGNYLWDNFINKSFTWSETEEGHSFWEAVHMMRNFNNYNKIAFGYIKQYPFEIWSKLSDNLQMLIFEETSYHNDSLTLENYVNNLKGAGERMSYRRFFADINSIARESRNDFWEKIKYAESYKEADHIAQQFTAPVTLYNGQTARSCDALLLSAEIYGAHKYALNYEITNTEQGRILGTDCITFYDVNTNKKKVHKSALNSKLTFNGLTFPAIIYSPQISNYAHALISYKYGVGVHYKTGKVIEINKFSHCLVNSIDFNFVAELSEVEKDENFVRINHCRHDYEIYMRKDSELVYQCAVSQQYYSLEFSSYTDYRFYDSEGVRTILKICNENQVSPLFEYQGQRFEPIATNNASDFRAVRYWSRQSAENAGIILEHCPHCNSLQSQYHDREACMNDHFKNERYGYHSQKPRYISSRSEFKIGVEIEKESFKGACHSHRDIFRSFGWVKESDSSLDGRIGYELVSPAFGLFGNNLIKEAQKLEERFPYLINGEASSACGGHIHFSRANTSGADTLEMYCGYLPLLYAIYKTRTKRDYCKSIEKEAMKYSRDKYQAVRVLDRRIEFRIFPAVKNVQTLAWRVELLRYMAKNPTSSPVQVVNDLCDKRTKLHKLFLEIFPEKTIYARAIDTLNMAQKYDRNFYNIDFSEQRKAIAKKAEKTATK